ncbi:hypothetical protein [Actinacidiphila oryziradicis]|jgi:hypothetical protein|uniref:Uncharacterized protein n=1 Tax=Actinacidiphila oryziradicis TaxID=2571141 RepID=A0A4U0SHY0_9ACTN|nr:hypothetical protein [Actinacidiphila oryziradicis]MCW2875484.1 hypothetical protein [Actinacidiphila oryziradicis]TKA08468.1 hypothetical protein FCI23_27515 [Actinacidiphila oryziradicis]
MAGSVTLGHADAERLAWVLKEMSDLLGMRGPNKITDSQVSALCEGQVHHREELARWTRTLSEELAHKL